MGYRLRDDLSACRIDDRLIFLDVRANRYFRLSAPLEHAIAIHMAGGTCEEPDIQRLVANNILTNEAPPPGQARVSTIEAPRRSAVEQVSTINKVSVTQLLEVFVLVYWTRRQLATRPLKDILDHLLDDRHRHIRSSVSPATRPSRKHLLDAVGVFRRARLYVPPAPCCLLDSLSMVRFLARRGVTANIVFGVTSDPFSAHCWTQIGDLVLNDSVGNANAYTAIRIV